VDALSSIIALHARVSASGFGRILLPPLKPFEGATGTVHVIPEGKAQTSIEQLMLELVRDHRFKYNRDQLELTYEHKKIALARVTFLAGAS
jgi:hypothetical protein